MTFDNLGPLLAEDRTEQVCALCNNFIYKQVYYDERSKDKRKTVFVCKNCLKNNNH